MTKKQQVAMIEEARTNTKSDDEFVQYLINLMDNHPDLVKCDNCETYIDITKSRRDENGLIKCTNPSGMCETVLDPQLYKLLKAKKK